jgi:hypothetical protein
MAKTASLSINGMIRRINSACLKYTVSITVDFTEKKSCGINQPPPHVLRLKNICRLRVPVPDFAERSSIFIESKSCGKCACVAAFLP